jgi:hypothetical protein
VARSDGAGIDLSTALVGYFDDDGWVRHGGRSPSEFWRLQANSHPQVPIAQLEPNV